MVDKITSCGRPVFVVWQNGKACPVVDLRGLNEMIVLDSYPLSYQDEIISSIYSCSFISTFDVVKTFGQMSVATKDRWKTMVKIQKGLYVHNILLQGCSISPTYMQRYMDKKLYCHKAYARCYVNNIVIFLKTFEEYI